MALNRPWLLSFLMKLGAWVGQAGSFLGIVSWLVGQKDYGARRRDP